MKRFLSLLLIVSFLPSLAACNTIYSNYREIQQLMVIQTLGLDLEKGGVRVSMAAPAEKSGSAPRQMSAWGGTISAAVDRAYDLSYEEEIFFSHINHILIGEETAETGINIFLDYVCQSPTLRLDIPLYIVREGSAKEAVMNAGNGSKGISEIMQAVRERFSSPSNSKVFTVMDTLSNLERHGSALVCAIRCTPSSESDGKQPSEQEDSSSKDSGGGKQPEEPVMAAPAGYAVIREGKLCKYIEPDEAIAIGLLLGSVPITPLEVQDRNGQPCTLEVDSGSSDIRPVWSGEGNLKGLEIQIHVSASVLETGTTEDTGSGEYSNHLTAQLEAAISKRVSSLLQSSMKLKADFLGLSSIVERQSPENYRLLDQSFSELLPGLELQITVSGELIHTNDTKDA